MIDAIAYAIQISSVVGENIGSLPPTPIAVNATNPTIKVIGMGKAISTNATTIAVLEVFNFPHTL